MSINKITNFKTVLFLYSLFLIFFRAPDFFLAPRFWAEEATIFFVYAYQKPFLEMLVKPIVGYSTFFNTLIANLCNLVPLEYAPNITTYACFFVQLISISIIIFKDFELWNTKVKKFFLVSILILITPYEIWLNTTNIHIHLGFIVFLISISFSENDSKFTKYSFRSLIFFGTISSPSAAFAGMVFFLRAIQEKTKESIIQFFIMLIACILQGSAIFYSALFNNKYSRFINFDSSSFMEYYLRDGFGLLLPFSDETVIYISLFIFIYFVYLIIQNWNQKLVQYLIISFFITSILSLLGSLKMQGSPRYSYIPSLILIIFFLNQTSKYNKFFNFRFQILLLYFILITINTTKDLHKFYQMSFPSWKSEVKKYKVDPNYRLNVFPYHKPHLIWDVDFNKKEIVQ